MKIAIEILIELILFLGALYFLFYKSFLREKGKQYAKLVTRKELIEIEENVKQEFRTKIEDYRTKITEDLSIKIENIRAQLTKNNISYQISLAELTKIRFSKIETLISDLITLQDFIRENMFIAENSDDFEKNKEQFNKLFKKADISRKLCSLYLSNELINKIIEVLNNSYKAYISFVKMYHTDPKQLGEISIWDLNTQRIKQKLTNENFKAYEKLLSEIENFPAILKYLSDELKKEVIFRNIEE